MNENGEDSRNKAFLVCKAYSKEEGIDVVRIEGVRTLLAYTTHKGVEVYQMYLKSKFFNEIVEDQVYIEKPEGSID